MFICQQSLNKKSFLEKNTIGLDASAPSFRRHQLIVLRLAPQTIFILQTFQEVVNSPSPQRMLCEDDENNSEPEIVTHDDVRPEESPEREPDVTSRQSAALEAKADSLADDLSKAALAGKGDGEKVAKRNDVAGAVGAVVAAGAAVGVVAAAGAAVATVSSPKSNRAPSPNVAADDDDDRPQPPDDDSVPDEDSLVIFLNSELALKYG